MKRRLLLKGSMACGALSVALGAGLLTPTSVFAAWPQASFDAKKLDDALTSLFGTNTYETTNKIKIKAPEIAENGAVVPIEASTEFSNVESMAIFIEKNPAPLTASFELSNSTKGFISTRVKMGKTSPVLIIVKADGKLYGATKEVKVTIGGCGG